MKARLDAREAAIAKMTPPDRRRIFREVDDNWNEPKGRYLMRRQRPNHCGKAEGSPVWVETVRRESFGDSADNDEIERLQGEIAKLEGTVQLQIDAALKVAASAGDHPEGGRGLSDRLQMVEKAVGLSSASRLAAHGHHRWLLTPNADRRKKGAGAVRAARPKSKAVNGCTKEVTPHI